MGNEEVQQLQEQLVHDKEERKLERDADEHTIHDLTKQLAAKADELKYCQRAFRDIDHRMKNLKQEHETLLLHDQVIELRLARQTETIDHLKEDLRKPRAIINEVVTDLDEIRERLVKGQTA